MAALIASVLTPEPFVRMFSGSHRLGMNTMLGLLLASIALIGWGRVRAVAGTAVIVVASIAIMQTATEIYPIDGAWRVLINTQVPMSSGDAWTGRLSLSAAIAFACIGIALTLLNRAHTTVMRVLLQLTISFVFVLAIIGLYGHLLGIIRQCQHRNHSLSAGWR